MIMKDKELTCFTSFTCAQQKEHGFRISTVLGKFYSNVSSFPLAAKMSFCGWSSGEVYKDHFENGKSRSVFMSVTQLIKEFLV